MNEANERMNEANSLSLSMTHTHTRTQFSFEMPKDFRGVKAMFAGRSHAEHFVIIQRLQACHNLALGAQYRQKIEV